MIFCINLAYTLECIEGIHLYVMIVIFSKCMLLTYIYKSSKQSCFHNRETLLKTLWEKEKMLVSILSKSKQQLLSHIYFVLCKCFQFRQIKTFNSLPNDKSFDWSKLKAFADDKKPVNVNLKFDLGRIENIVGKGKNAAYQHFLLFPPCFLKLSSQSQ